MLAAAVKDTIKTEIASYESIDITQSGSETLSCWGHSAGETERTVNEHSETPTEADLENCHDQNQEVDQSENEAEHFALERCDQ